MASSDDLLERDSAIGWENWFCMELKDTNYTLA
jgi:hypothetical protein